MDTRRMCPHCRAFITTSDQVCPYCGEKVGPKAIDTRDTGALLMGFIPSARFTTVIILLINFGFFLATMVGGGRIVIFGEENGLAIVDHEWYRLVTAGFLHAGLMHILMNSWVLYDLGAEVEQMFQPARMIVIYFLATIGGFLASAYLFPLTPSVGASAGIFGLIGAMIALGFRANNSMGREIRGHYIRWAIYGLLFGLLPFMRVNNTAHIGGLVTGFVTAYVAGLPSHATRSGESFWRGAAGLCVFLTAVSFFQLFLRISGNPQ